MQRHVLIARIGDGAADKGHHDKREFADLEAPQQRAIEQRARDDVAEHRDEFAGQRQHDDDFSEPLDQARDVRGARFGHVQNAIGEKRRRGAGNDVGLG